MRFCFILCDVIAWNELAIKLFQFMELLFTLNVKWMN